jgi:hypothetical protein
MHQGSPTSQSPQISTELQKKSSFLIGPITKRLGGGRSAGHLALNVPPLSRPLPILMLPLHVEAAMTELGQPALQTEIWTEKAAKWH